MKDQPTDTKASIPSNAIIALLTDQRQGEAMKEASEAMRDCLEAVDATGKPAKLTLTLTFTPSKAIAFIVSDEIKTKLPEAEKANSIFFLNESGALQRNDPRQKEMDLKVVGGSLAEPTTLKTAANQ